MKKLFITLLVCVFMTTLNAQVSVQVETNLNLTGLSVSLFNEDFNSEPLNDMYIYEKSILNLMLEPGVYTILIDKQYYININVPNATDLSTVYDEAIFGDTNKVDLAFEPKEDLIFLAAKSKKKSPRRKNKRLFDKMGPH